MSKSVTVPAWMEELFAHVAAQPPIKFMPQLHYDPDGDCFEFFLSNESYYGRQIDQHATLYYSQETGRVVGGSIVNPKDRPPIDLTADAR